MCGHGNDPADIQPRRPGSDRERANMDTRKPVEFLVNPDVPRLTDDVDLLESEPEVEVSDTKYRLERGKDGILYKVGNGRDEPCTGTGNPHIPYFYQWVEDWEPVQPADIKRPRCEHKGSLPHTATRIVVWELACGRQTKFMCEEHFKGIGSQPYWFGTLNGIWV